VITKCSSSYLDAINKAFNDAYGGSDMDVIDEEPETPGESESG